MSATQLLAFGADSQNDGQTRYYTLSGVIPPTAAITTEAEGQIPVRDAGTFSNLYFRLTSNACTVNTVVTLRKSGVATALTLTVGPDATGEFEDVTHSVAFANTELAGLEVAIPSEPGGNQLVVSVIGVLFAATSGTVSMQSGVAAGDSFSTASATRFYPLTARNDSSVIETNVHWRVTATFTARNLSVYVSGNARSTDSVWTSRKNAGAGSMTLTFATAETGLKEDTSNSDSLVADDEYNLALTNGTGTGDITTTMTTVAIASAADQFPLQNSGNPVSQDFGVTNYLNFGRIGSASATESDAQLLTRLTYTASHLTARVTPNSLPSGATATVRCRVNAADGNQVLVFTSAETGVKTDAANTDVLTAGTDRYNVAIVTTGASGSVAVRAVSMLGTVASAAVGNPWYAYAQQ
jgi:hypothetical protein